MDGRSIPRETEMLGERMDDDGGPTTWASAPSHRPEPQLSTKPALWSGRPTALAGLKRNNRFIGRAHNDLRSIGSYPQPFPVVTEAYTIVPLL